MLNLNSADVLFYNGLGMESWIDKVKGAVNGEKQNMLSFLLLLSIQKMTLTFGLTQKM